jgi:hypothetical protein
MNGEEAVRATILSGLRAGRTVSEIVSFNNISKSTVKHLKKRYDEFIAGGGLPKSSALRERATGGGVTPWTTTQWPPSSSLSTGILGGP